MISNFLQRSIFQKLTNDHFLLETIWVMVAYGPWHLVAGFVIASAFVITASRCVRIYFRLPVLTVAVFVLWGAMFMSADGGYQAWQSIPNTPDEAYSDTGPLLFLVVGWIPSTAFVYLLLRLCRRFSPLIPTAELVSSKKGL